MSFWSNWSDGKKWGMGIVAALIVSGLLSAATHVHPVECEDTVKLAGGELGCRAYKNTVQEIDIKHCGFSKTPVIITNGSPGTLNDTVVVPVSSRNMNRFTVLITTTGTEGNLVCANTSFSWSAKE